MSASRSRTRGARSAGRERRAELPARNREREVPRDDEADDAERLAERHVDAARDGNRVAEQPLGRPGVVVEHVVFLAT
jgi:hypothetical protein